MWDSRKNKVTVGSIGENVKVEPFDNEKKGQRSIKQINWKPNQKIQFILEGRYDKRINRWTLQCMVKIDREEHFLAQFHRNGRKEILQAFKFSSFIEDFHRTPGAHGCDYERSAQFYNPSIQYTKNNGQKETVLLNKAQFTKDQTHELAVCSDWACASSGFHVASLKTGGSRLGKPKNICNHNDVLDLNRSKYFVDGNTTGGPLKFCIKKGV